MPSGTTSSTGMNICAMMHPSCAMVASTSPRCIVHHGCDGAFSSFASKASLGRHEKGGGGSDLERFERFGREELFGFELALRKPLLEGVAEKCFQSSCVAFEPIGPKVGAHQAAGFVEVAAQPRQHAIQRARIGELIAGERFCARECLEE